MTPGVCQCVPEWTGERHHWACLLAGQKRVPDPLPCVCGHAKDLLMDVTLRRCSIERCPCTRYQIWGQQ